MFQWKSSLALLAVTLAALLAQNSSDDVQRVGSRLACNCGCSHTVASCDMFECSFSKPAKLRIAKLKAQGVSDQGIIDQFVREYGPQIYRAAPNAFGWIIPYASIVPGLLVIWWFVRRYRRPRPIPVLDAPLELDDPELAKYKDQIEKDLARLD